MNKTERYGKAMKKFMVVVNNKYLVRVESTSNCSTEHLILDSIKGSKTAMSFDIEEGETRTEYFEHFLRICDMISYDELRRKDLIAKVKQMEWLNDRYDEMHEITKAIGEMRRERDSLDIRIRAAEDDILQLKDTCKEHADRYGIENKMTSDHYLDALKREIANPEQEKPQSQAK